MGVSGGCCKWDFRHWHGHYVGLNKLDGSSLVDVACSRSPGMLVFIGITRRKIVFLQVQ